MRRAGSADLPLHGGRVPAWLGARMSRLGAVIAQAIVHHYGRDEFLRRLAHPFWFQSFGAVMGMDWHSSGITTSVIGALKRGLAPLSGELGIHVCGGRGNHSRKTPLELAQIGERVGVDGDALARASRLVAKVDSAAVQDGFDLYLHGFIVTDDGKWTVVQQGMNGDSRLARRYHWLSEDLRSFVDAPHSAIDGPNQGRIVNLTDHRAAASREDQLVLLREQSPDFIVAEAGLLAASRPDLFADGGSGGRATAAKRASGRPPSGGSRHPGDSKQGQLDLPYMDQPSMVQPYTDRSSMNRPYAGQSHVDRPHTGQPHVGQPHTDQPRMGQPHLVMPVHHDVRPKDVNLRRLHAALAAAAECGPMDFADLLLVPGVGARTVRSLALVAEVVHGAPCRFTDPARFSMAHGGKDRHPYPVPLDVYDHTIDVMKTAVSQARLGNDEKLEALKRLDRQARRLEHTARGPALPDLIEEERRDSPDYGGRSVFGWEVRAHVAAGNEPPESDE
jgi:hypothetical protein